MVLGVQVFSSVCREQNTTHLAQSGQTPKTAQAQLMAGNKPFVNDTPAHPHQTHSRILETEGNIRHGVAQIKRDEPVLTEKIREGNLLVVPMLYDVHPGKVVVLE